MIWKLCNNNKIDFAHYYLDIVEIYNGTKITLFIKVQVKKKQNERPTHTDSIVLRVISEIYRAKP